MGPVAAYRYFYDCEFIEDGRVIDLVSIGMVDERGREFYAVSTEFDDTHALPWVRRNVLDKLPSPADSAWRSRERIRADLFEFMIEPGEEIELWAWYAAYDHVALAQLWGPMPTLAQPAMSSATAMAAMRRGRTVGIRSRSFPAQLTSQLQPKYPEGRTAVHPGRHFIEVVTPGALPR